MPKHRLGLPPEYWPANLRARLDALLDGTGEDQRRRLRQAFGRWLKLAEDEGVAPDAVDAAIWARRAAGLGADARRAMRQAVGLVWPASLDATQALRTGEQLRKAPDRRERRARAIDRLVARLPEPWRAAAAPLVAMGATPLDDGLLHEAWRPSTIIGRLEALARHLAFCAAAGLPLAVTPKSVRAALDDAQAEKRLDRRKAQGSSEGRSGAPAASRRRSKLRPMRPGGIAAEIGSLLGAVRAVMPERDWSWLATAERSISKRARAYGSRNESRIVDVTDLRRAGLATMDAARAAHVAARGLRERTRAHDRARGGS